MGEGPNHTWPDGRLQGREAWAQALAAVLELALAERVRQMAWCDPDFADWPLGERVLTESLHAWSRAGGQLSLLALDYRTLRERHARFVTWRTQWSHRVDARAAPRELREGFPTLVCLPGWAMSRSPSRPPVVLASAEPARVQGLTLAWQGLWERSSAAFPATTLGL